MPPCPQTASTQSVIKTIADTFQKPWIKWIAGEVFEGDKKFAKSLGDGKWNFKLQDENDDCEKHRPARLCPLPRLASAHTCTCRRLAICRCADFGIAFWSLKAKVGRKGGYSKSALTHVCDGWPYPPPAVVHHFAVAISDPKEGEHRSGIAQTGRQSVRVGSTRL